ncbi:MAG: hypothetical protein ACYC3I_08105 [Gemmataceae bacterium]
MGLDQWYRKWRTQRRTRPVCRTPALRLEQLEDRMLPSGGLSAPPPNTGPAAAPPPPSTFQAALSLYLDAAFLEASNVANQYIAANPDEYNLVPSVTTNINASAAAAGINLDAATHLAGFLENLRGFENGLAQQNPVSPETLAMQDIQHNWPYAGPFASFALKAGVEAALQRVQQPPSSS